MQCKNHADIPAVDRCSGCAESFCADCLVTVLGQKYCASCKVLAIQGKHVVLEEATIPCSEAGEALTFAILSLFCFGMILGPMALFKAHKAKKIIDEDPRLTGWGKANAAMAIAIVAIVVWAIGTMAGAHSHSARPR